MVATQLAEITQTRKRLSQREEQINAKQDALEKLFISTRLEPQTQQLEQPNPEPEQALQENELDQQPIQQENQIEVQDDPKNQVVQNQNDQKDSEGFKQMSKTDKSSQKSETQMGLGNVAQRQLQNTPPLVLNPPATAKATPIILADNQKDEISQLKQEISHLKDENRSRKFFQEEYSKLEKRLETESGNFTKYKDDSNHRISSFEEREYESSKELTALKKQLVQLQFVNESHMQSKQRWLQTSSVLSCVLFGILLMMILKSGFFWHEIIT